MIRKIAYVCLLGLLLPGCRPEPAESGSADPGSALADSLEALIPLTAPRAATYPGPDPFVGSYRNDPDVEGFLRRLEIDSAGAAGYRVRLTAEEVSGERLCRHAATFERVDTSVLRGRIEGYELLIHSAEAALEVRPVDATLRASPGLLCPGASIFGWWLPQWVYAEGFADTLGLPDRDEWLADDYRNDYNRALAASGQPEARIRYETEILTRGDYDGDGAWDYAALLRDTSGRRGLYVRRGDRSRDTPSRIAELTQTDEGSTTLHFGVGLDTEPAGETFYDWSTDKPFTLPRPGIMLQHYEKSAVLFYWEQGRWRRVPVSD